MFLNKYVCLAFITSCFIFVFVQIAIFKAKNIHYRIHREISLTTNNPGKYSYVREQSSKTRIGVLIPATSRGMKIIDIRSISLVKICIKSLRDSMETAYEYTVYIGVDMNDTLLSHQYYIEGLHTSVIMVRVNGNTFTKAVNTIAEEAVKDRMDYLVRINDDIKFVTNNWTSLGIESLQNNEPPNIGVVGPTCKQGKTTILTTDFVHVSHFNIFGFYYPPQFDNWWVDDWITRVYQPLRSEKLSNWEVVHTRSYGQRYKVVGKQRELLEDLISWGKQTIALYVNYHIRRFPLEKQDGT